MKQIKVFLIFILFHTVFANELGIGEFKVFPETTKEGNFVYVDFYFNTVSNNKLNINFYFENTKDGSVLFSNEKNIKVDKNIKRIEIKIPDDLNINALYPQEAVETRIVATINSEKMLIGTVKLYKDYNIFRLKDVLYYGLAVPNYRIPFYILLMSLLGAIGYVLVSLYRRTEWKFRRILKLILRLILSVLLGIFLYTFYMATTLKPNSYLLSALAFGTGFYISPVLYKLREFIYKKLAPSKKIIDNIKDIVANRENELCQKCKISARVVYYLSQYGILTVEDLKSMSDSLIKEASEKYKIDENYLREKKKKAIEMSCEKEKNIKEELK